MHSRNGKYTLRGEHFFESSQVLEHTTVITSLSHGPKPRHDCRSTRLSVPLARISRFSLCAYNKKRVRASGTFGMLAICVNCIDETYLRKNAVNAHTHCREQKIRVSICYLSISRRSPRRRRKTNPPPSGRRIVQNALFRQRGVRMSSTQGRHLRSASPEGIAVDHGPAANLAAP